MLTLEEARRLRKGHKILIDATDHYCRNERYVNDIIATRTLCTVSKAFSESMGFVRYELDTGNGNILRGVVGIGSITRVMKKGWKQCEGNEARVIDAINARRDRIQQAIHGPRTPLAERDLRFETRAELETNYNHIRVGEWSLTGQFTPRHSYFCQICCSLTKTTEDLEVLIPKVFLDYFGYTEEDLVNWLEFLRNCNFGFVARYNGLQESINAPSGYTESYEKRDHNPMDRIITYQNCYSIYLQNSGTQTNTYGNFIALRYIYNNQYWNIPATAMRIKAELGNEISHWRALMLAHLRQQYYYYYSFLNPSQGIGIPNVMKNPNEIFGADHDQRYGPYLNSRFGTIREISFPTVMRFFETENYRGLWEYLRTSSPQISL